MAATENPEWAEKMTGESADWIAPGLDVRGKTLAGRGWMTQGPNLSEMTTRFDAAGCTRYVTTDVSRDGMLPGPNFELLACLCEATDAAIVISGGVSSLRDTEVIRGLVDVGVEGVIVGKALYSGHFTLLEAFDVAVGASAR